MYNLLKLNLARNSLRYIIQTYKIKELYIPYYLCKVIRTSIIKEHCKPVFYHIDDDFLPTIDFPENSFILYPDYFGICEKNISVLLNKYNNLIIDNAHAFYSEPKGFACFNSARKFLPVYNGSYLWIKNNELNFNEEQEYKSAPQNDKEREQCEISFENDEILFLNKNEGKEILKFNDKEERKIKFLQYHEKYKSFNLLDIDTETVISPFCYPCLLKDIEIANNLVNELKQQGLTIYRYWEKLPTDFPEYKFYERLVCIPLTQ